MQIASIVVLAAATIADTSLITATDITACPAGNFYQSTSSSCQPCPIGTYQNQGGQSECLSCQSSGSDAVAECGTNEGCWAYNEGMSTCPPRDCSTCDGSGFGCHGSAWDEPCPGVATCTVKICVDQNTIDLYPQLDSSYLCANVEQPAIQFDNSSASTTCNNWFATWVCTNAPTTDAPITGSPTNAPTTDAPTTNAPTTDAPITGSPTNAPTTDAPITGSPVQRGTATPTSAPTTAAPTAPTSAPSTVAPTAAALTSLNLEYSDETAGPALLPTFRSSERTYGPMACRRISAATDYIIVNYQAQVASSGWTISYKDSASTTYQQTAADSEDPIPLLQNSQTIILLADTKQPAFNYEIYLTRQMPDCLDSDLSAWSDWSECTASCSATGAQVTRTRSILDGASCSAILAQATIQSCGQLECLQTVTGSLALSQIDKTTFEDNIYGFRTSIAQAAGAQVSDVEVISVTETSTRRALSISVEFTILTSDSAAASSSLGTAVSDGSWATLYAEDVQLYGAAIVSVVVDGVSTSSQTDTVVVESSNHASDAALWSVALVNLLLVALILLIWLLLAYDIFKVSSTPEIESEQVMSSAASPSHSERLSETAAGLASNSSATESVELLRSMAMQSAPVLDLLETVAAEDKLDDANLSSSVSQRNATRVGTQGGKGEPVLLQLGLFDYMLSGLFVSSVLVCVALSCSWVPSRELEMIRNVTTSVECQAQNYAALVTSRIVTEMIDTTQRNIDMYSNSVMTWQSVSVYANDQLTSSQIYTSSLPAVLLSVLNSTSESDATLQSLYAVIPRTDASDSKSCSVFSAEWINETSTPLVGRMYDHSAQTCYQASYSSSTGYGSWSEVTDTSGIGPLSSSCSSVTDESWYTTACSLGAAASSITVDVLNTKDASYAGTGMRYVKRLLATHPAFGAELNGLRISSDLSKAKPTKGEVYIVSTSNGNTTLLASTELSAALQLQAAESDIDPTSVGGLTGASASSLESDLNTFPNLWERSESVAMAEGYGQVASTCPSSTTLAYIAIGQGSGISSTPTSSLQRFNTSVSDVEFMLVNTLHGDAYMNDATVALALGICLALVNLFCMVLLAWLPTFLLQSQLHPNEQQGLGRLYSVVQMTGASGLWFKKRHAKLIWAILSVATFVSCVIWLIVLSNSHKAAIKDFGEQVGSSINTALGLKLSSSSTLAQQATMLWYHTGKATTSLSVLNKWTTLLMADFYTHNGLSTLQFATQTDGLEQGANGTSSGVRVLSRSSSTSCLETSTFDSGTDSTTSDSTNFPDDCYYDPRYTTWYTTGEASATDPDFTTTYDNEWLATVAKACTSGSPCTASTATSGWVSPTPSPTATGVGVWAAEWKINSLAAALTTLQAGLTGSLSIVDTSAIVLSSSSSISVEPALTCGDAYINGAAKQINSKFDYDWSAAAGLLRGNEIVYVGQMSWAADPSLATGYFVSLMSFERSPLYSTYEDTISTSLACVLVGMLMVGVVSSKQLRKVLLFIDTTTKNEDSKRATFAESKAHPYLHSLEMLLQSYVQALDLHFQDHPPNRNQIFQLAGLMKPLHASKDETVSPEEALEHMAVSFLSDTFRDRDVLLHMVLLLRGGRFKVYLIRAFKMITSPLYQSIINVLIASLIILSINEYVFMPIWGSIVGLLFVDICFTNMFLMMRSTGFEVKKDLTKDPPTEYSRGTPDSIIIPWRVKGHLITAIMYPAMWLLAVSCHDLGVSPYLWPLMFVLRNDDMWPSLSIFLAAMGAASHVIYLFFCLLIVLAGLVGVLLYNQYNTGDFYTDNQYQQFAQSVTTMFIYLASGENFVEAVSPALEISFAYGLLFFACSLLGLFFISSLLIEVFANAWQKGREGKSTPDRRRTLAALATTFLVWTQTQKALQEFGTGRTKESIRHSCFVNGHMRDSELDVMPHPHAMNRKMFEDLMLAQPLMLDQILELLDQILKQLKKEEVKVRRKLKQDPEAHVERVSDKFAVELAAIASICCALGRQDEYEYLRRHKWIDSEAEDTPVHAREGNHQMQLGEVLQKVQLSLTGAEAELSLSAFKQQFVLSLFPGSSNLVQSFGSNSSRPLYTEAVKVSKILSETRVPLFTPHALVSLRAVCTSSIRMNDHVADISDKLTPEEKESQLTALLDEAATRVYRLNQRSKISSEAVRLVKLVQLHKWRIQILFNFLDTDNSQGLTVVEFDRLFCLARLSSRLACDPALRNEAEVMRVESQISDLHIEIAGTSHPSDRKQKRAEIQSKSEELAKLQAVVFRARHSGLWSEKVEASIVVQLVAWLNLAVAAAGGIDSCKDTVDILLCLFPPFFAMELVVQMWFAGFVDYLISAARPDQAEGRRLSLIFVCIACIGAIVLAIEPSHLSRVLASCSILLIITRNERFAKMLQTFRLSFAACAALVASLVVLMLLFALASRDMFGEGPADDDGMPYFSSYSRSLSTMFRLFVGEGWHDVMYSASDSTTEAARLWLMAYMFVVGMLYSELFVGVIISLYSDVAAISSPHVFSVLEPIFRDFSSADREFLIEDMLELNHQTRSYNILFNQIVNSDEVGRQPSINPDLVMHKHSKVPRRRGTLADARIDKVLAGLSSQLCKDVKRLFDAFASMVATEAKVSESFRTSTVQPIGFTPELVNSYLGSLEEELRALFTQWEGAFDKASGGLLKDCEQLMYRWLTQLVGSFCERALGAFIFVPDTDRIPKLDAGLELHATCMHAMHKLPQMEPVSAASAALCNHLVLTLTDNILAVSGSDSVAQCTGSLWSGVPMEQAPHSELALVPAAEELFAKMAAMGEEAAFDNAQLRVDSEPMGSSIDNQVNSSEPSVEMNVTHSPFDLRESIDHRLSAPNSFRSDDIII